MLNLHMQTAMGSFDSIIKIEDLSRIESPVLFMVNPTLIDTIDFYKTVKSLGKKPVIGLHVYVAYGDTDSLRNMYGQVYSEYTLIALNRQGYENLIRINTTAYMDGFFQRPRTDFRTMNKHKEGVCCLINSKSSSIAKHIEFGNLTEASREFWALGNIYGDNLYVERFLDTNPDILAQLDVVTSSLPQTHQLVSYVCKYIDKEDVLYYKFLYAIQKNINVSNVSDDEVDGFHYKTDLNCDNELLINLFHFIDRVEDYELNQAEPQLPDLGIKSEDFRTWMYKLLEEKGLYQNTKYFERLEYELSTILKYGYHAYFIIVHDLIRHCNEDLSGYISAGRGSVGGCLVAYLLGITRVDPVHPDGFNMSIPFDRFLNAGRKVMPDIDMDFSPNDRGGIIQYLLDKYGENSVKYMTTIVTNGARSSLREVARISGLLDNNISAIIKSFPHDQQLTLAMVKESDLYKANLDNPTFVELFDIALKMEGLPRNMGIHASGIALSPFNMEGKVPFIRHSSDKIATQYGQDDLDYMGIIKLDVLGLNVLSIIRDTVNLIHPDFNSSQIIKWLNELPTKDAEVFNFICDRQIQGVFQWDTHNYDTVIKKMKPNSFKELVDLNTLGRSASLLSGLTDRYINRKFGRESIEPLHPALKGLMTETLELPLYQEQMMQVFVSLAGYTLAEADDVRKAIGKKKPELLQQQKLKFIDGCCAHSGMQDGEIEEIWEIIEKFSKYTWNLGHALTYTKICYESAYLSYHYPKEFYCACINNDNDANSTGHFVSALTKRGHQVMPLDINKSEMGYCVKDGQILSGFAGLKYVGEKTAKLILERRPYKNYKDFESKFTKKEVNKKTVISLYCAGGFDIFVDGEGEEDKTEQREALLKRIAEDLRKTRIDQFLHSGRITKDIHQFFPTEKFDEIKDLNSQSQVVVIAYLIELREIYTKNNKKMAFAVIQEFDKRHEIVIFPQTWEKYGDYVVKHKLHRLKLIYNNGLCCNEIVAWQEEEKC